MITLNRPLETVVQTTQQISTVTVDRYVDLPSQKVVRAFITELNRPIELWVGDAYDAIGDWTAAQAEARVIEVLEV
jgi:hypothetical protein